MKFAIDMVVLRTTEKMINCKFVDMVSLRTKADIQLYLLYIRNSPMPVKASITQTNNQRSQPMAVRAFISIKNQ
ncbi:MAG: hypothetical protein PHH23_05625 [Paludibacteraceae bacterium]|nr:hypothetical protein [Paludibacteraceae bacterium]